MTADRARRQRDLTPSQQVIIDVFKNGPATIDEVAEKTGQAYTTVYRPLKTLERAGYIELDSEASAFKKSNIYRIKRTPNDGVEVIVTVNGEQRFISFNTLVESYAKQTKLPEIATRWRELPKALAILETLAVNELMEAGSVSEADLLEVKSGLKRYEETLADQLGIVRQLNQDNRLWEPSLLKTVLTKTDRTLSPSDARALATMLVQKFLTNSTIENESEGNDDAE